MRTGGLYPKSRRLYPKEALLLDHGDDPTVHEQRRARIMVTEHDSAIYSEGIHHRARWRARPI
jgi:hypothetical protein